MNKKMLYGIIALVIVLVIAAFAWWREGARKAEQMQMAPSQAVAPVDTTKAINADVANINVGDVSTDFKDVDATMKGL